MLNLGALEILFVLMLPLSGLVAAAYLAIVLRRNTARDRDDS